jgi:hypothetical protein
MVKFCQVMAVVLLLGLQVACGGPAPTAVPAPQSTPTGPLNLALSLEAVPAAGGSTQLSFGVANHGAQDVYLAYCGTWVIYRDEDPEQPAWSLPCDINYLGNRVRPGGTWRDRLTVQLAPGTYHARALAYGDCTLGAPREYSPREVDYGSFDACAVQQEIVSPAFQVQ